MSGIVFKTFGSWKTVEWLESSRAKDQEIIAIFQAFSAIKEWKLLEELIDQILKSYSVHSAIIPAVKFLGMRLHSEAEEKKQLIKLNNYCIDKLKQRTEIRPETPSTWERELIHSCRCIDCTALSSFLSDAELNTYNFKASKDRRNHVEEQVRKSKCDLDFKTITSGSPHTLSCIKNKKSYENMNRVYNEDTEFLIQLRQLEEVFSQS